MVMMASVQRKQSDDDMRIATVKQEFTVGLLFRGMFRKLLEKQQFSQDDIEIQFFESKGFIESDFVVKVSGPVAMCKAWFEAIECWIDELNKDD